MGGNAMKQDGGKRSVALTLFVFFSHVPYSCCVEEMYACRSVLHHARVQNSIVKKNRS